MTIQAVATMSNQHALCICEITTREAEVSIEEDPSFDGMGLYLIKVDRRALNKPGKVLAKFVSEDAAKVLARFFQIHGQLEMA